MGKSASQSRAMRWLGRNWPGWRTPGSNEGGRLHLGLEALEDRLAPSVYTVLNTNSTGPGSLAAAVSAADSDRSGTPILINFTAGPGQTFATAQTIPLGGWLALTNTLAPSITLQGLTAGVTLDGGHAYTIVKIASGVTANLASLILSNGQASIKDPNAINNDGGGIYNLGSLTLTNSTITQCAANYAGGGIDVDGGTLFLQNSIVAKNTASSGPDIAGTVNDPQYDLACNITGSTAILSGGTSLFGTSTSPLDPRLAPLGNYGGSTLTMALLPGSPALRAGPL